MMETIASKEHNSQDLTRLIYDKKDEQEILPYAEAFNEIHDKIGQDFSLRKIGEGTRANIFEIYNDQKGIYVVKLPRTLYRENKDINIKQKAKQEIANQQRFNLHYEKLAKKYDKILNEHLTHQAKGEIISNLTHGKKEKNQTLYGEEYNAILEKRAILNNIKIPKILELYQGELPIIIMDKIPGKSLWYETANFIFSPIFNSKIQYDLEEREIITGKQKFKDWVTDNHITDKKLEEILLLIFKGSKNSKDSSLINPILGEELSPYNLCLSLGGRCKRSPSETLFQILYSGDTEKMEKLKKTYEFFTGEFGIPHPDPNLYNFIITPDNKLGIIDFG